jgi:MoaA/NifB/PqqE/SkfB family radical SAM enzyme
MSILQDALLEVLLRYLVSDPMAKLPTMLSIVEKLDRHRTYEREISAVRKALTDETCVWYRFADSLFRGVDKHSLRKLVECLAINGSIAGGTHARSIESQYDINVPWAILMDPTSACNLSCTGCWAAQYTHTDNLDYETMDSICRQGKELGTHFYIFSGGEPLVRKDDILSLCEEHQDCYFLSFTNGTLVDDELCQSLVRLGNLALAFSIEGDEALTDMRRGSGTHRKVVEAMERMRDHRLLFGYSTCYHRYNTESVGSDEFVDQMISLGCRFAWNFTYIPIGKDARVDMLATPEQREYMYHRIREIRDSKPIFALDFWNDGEFTKGCIAAGRNYIHINAAGDVEPCAFIHYANVNIHDVTLLEALQSPLFRAFKERQPFNENMLRPCPLLDNPQTLVEMVQVSGAYSTDAGAPEPVEVLCAKTVEAAERWAAVADRIWRERAAALGGDEEVGDDTAQEAAGNGTGDRAVSGCEAGAEAGGGIDTGGGAEVGAAGVREVSAQNGAQVGRELAGSVERGDELVGSRGADSMDGECEDEAGPILEEVEVSPA